jgi:hypothetical protein
MGTVGTERKNAKLMISKTKNRVAI